MIHRTTFAIASPGLGYKQEPPPLTWCVDSVNQTQFLRLAWQAFYWLSSFPSLDQAFVTLVLWAQHPATSRTCSCMSFLSGVQRSMAGDGAVVWWTLSSSRLLSFLFLYLTRHWNSGYVTEAVLEGRIRLWDGSLLDMFFVGKKCTKRWWLEVSFLLEFEREGMTPQFEFLVPIQLLYTTK